MSYYGRLHGEEWTTVTHRRGRQRRDDSPERYPRPKSTYTNRDGPQNHCGDYEGERGPRTERSPRSPRRDRAPPVRHNAPPAFHLRRSPSRERRRTYASVTRTGRPTHDRVSPRRNKSRQDRRDPSDHLRQRRAPEAHNRHGPDSGSASRYRRNGPNTDHRPHPPHQVDRINRGGFPIRHQKNYGGGISPRRSRYSDDSRRRAAPAPQPTTTYSRQTDTRKRRWEDHQHRPTRNITEQRRQEDSRPRSDDPDFARKCHVLHRIIKTVHHLSNVSTEKTPVSINRMMKQLITMIKPAIPSPQTSELIEGNARNWAHTTLIILRNHYEQVMEKEITELYDFETLEWHAPFEIASNWAKRHFGRRLTPETLTQMKEIITEELIRLQEHSVPPTPEDLEAPPDSATTDPPRQEQDTNAGAQPAQITVQVHAANTVGPPQTPAHSPVPTTQREEVTGHRRPLSSAWSEPDLRTVEDTQEELLPSTTPQHLSPRLQRSRRIFVAGTGNIVQPTLPLVGPGPPPPSSPHIPAQGNGCVAHDTDSIDGLSPTQRTALPEEETGASGGPPPISEPTIRATRTTNTLQTAVQSQLTSTVTTASLFTPQTAGLCRPSRHMTSSRKIKDWHLNIHKKWIIIGDSNVFKLPPHNITDLQIDSFPGANFRHAEGILENTTISTTVEKIILSFGICSRDQKARETTVKQLQSMLRVAKLNFPEAEIWVPQINFSAHLSDREKYNLTHMNTYIALLGKYIALLPSTHFHTETDNVHWTNETAKAMFDHWCVHLN